ncbi:MAG TPA: hypothetical protein VKP30_11365 [Polyangiaceae bacterium]|nr:hypothetical protein [Polyangiaceae bacterium]
MKTYRSIVAVAVGVLTSAHAMAQSRPWLADRAYGEGMGIRTGDLELHPSVAGEVGYDSNYFQRSGDSGPNYPWDNKGISSAMRFRLTPSLTISTLSPQRKVGDAAGTTMPPQLNLSAGAFASYNELVGVSGDDSFSKQRHIDGGVNLLLDILPQRPFGVDVMADYLRIVAPSNDPAVTNAWNRDLLHGGVGVTWRPGGGLFDWRLGYDFQYNYFESKAFRTYNNIRNTINTRGRWKFYPRTALIYDAQTSWLSYSSSTPPRNGGQTIQSRLGINGLVTNHFALLAMAGWASTFYDGKRVRVPENLNTVIGQAELRWYILPQPKLQPGDATVGLSSLAVGYIRDFSQSYLADYYRRDRGYANISYFIGGRYLLDLQAGYSRISHPQHYRAIDARPDRLYPALGENRVDAQLFGEYRTSDTFGLNMTLRYDGSVSRSQIAITTADGETRYDNLAFSRFSAWLGVRWFM